MKNISLAIGLLGIVFALSLASTALAKNTSKEEKACAAGDLIACADLGRRLMRGYDSDRAESVLKSACDKGGALACSRLGYYYHEFEDRSDLAEPYLIKGCDGDISSACGNLGFMYGRSGEFNRDDEKAAGFDKKACDLNSKALACLRLAYAYGAGHGVPEDDVYAIAIFDNSCKAGLKFACSDLASKYVKGEGVEISFSKALDIYKSLCKSDFPNSCYRAGTLYETGGPDLSKQTKTAIKYYKKACKKHSGKGCRKLRELSTK